MIPFTCPCCEVSHPPHRDGCTLHEDCPNEADLFDEVSSMRAEIARLHDERQWIPVGERLPDDNVAVLVNHDSGGVEMAYLKDGLWCISWTGFKHSGVAYTHWMPLPAPPNGGEVE